MMNKSAKVRKSINNLSDFIQGQIDKYEGNDHASEVHSFLCDIQKELKRQERAFDTRRFFVVTIGALKAGKSTLINALTGCKVSPAGTGAETTKKCSIIMSADEEHPEGITLYRYKKPAVEQDDEQRKETCEKATRTLMDYFKGICDWDEVSKDFEKKPYPLRANNIVPNGPDNLEYILTSSDYSALQQFRDYMLAEIRIKTDPNTQSVLSQNVAIIDMPGLDGTMAGVASDDVNPNGNPINFLPKFSHLYLLVQSSISGLNRTTADMLHNWQRGKRSTPVYLVFNNINSKAEWCNDLNIQQESEERQRSAVAELQQQKVIYRDCYTVNAAQAWESCQPEVYERGWKQGITALKLREESNIDILIGSLKNAFAEQKDRIIQEDAVNGVSNALKDFIGRASNLRKSASEKRNELRNDLKVYESVLKCLDNCNNAIRRDYIETQFGNDWNTQLSNATTKVENAVNAGCKFPWLSSEKTKCAQVEQLAKNVKTCLKRAHVEQGFVGAVNDLMIFHFNKYYTNLITQLDSMIIDMPASKEFIEEVKSEIRRFELWPDQETRSELQEQFTLLDPVDCVDRDKLNSFWRRPFFKKTLEKYGMDFIEQFQHDYMQHLETVLKEKLDSFCIATDPHSDCLLNRRVNAVREHLVAMQGKHEAKCSADIAQYDEIIAVIPELVEQIKHLEDACSTFERELSI